MNFAIKQDARGFSYYQSEEEPPKEGPRLWLRPSDGAHFARADDGVWFQYNPINLTVQMKKGESVIVSVPPLKL